MPDQGRQGAQLLARFIEKPSSEKLRAQVEEALHHGLPTEMLGPLLTSGDPDLARAAVYWAWDVVFEDAHLILSELCDLLDSAEMPRAFVVASIQQTRTVRPDVLARVLGHLDDSDDQIAADVIDFLSGLEPQQLDVLVQCTDEPSIAVALTEHLASSRLSPQKVRAGLADPDARIGRIATAKVQDKLRFAEDPRRAAAPAVASQAEQLLYEIRDGSDSVAAKAADEHLFSMWIDDELEPRRRRDRCRVKWFHFKVSGPTPRNLWESLTFRVEGFWHRNDPDW